MSTDLSDLVSAAKKLGKQAENLDRRLSELMQQAEGAALLEIKLSSMLDEHTVNLEEDFHELSTKSNSRKGSDLVKCTECDLQELRVASQEYRDLNDKIMHKMTRLEAELERLSAEYDEAQRELQALRAAPPSAEMELEVAALRAERDLLLGQNCGLIAKAAQLAELGGSLTLWPTHSHCAHLAKCLSHPVWLSLLVALTVPLCFSMSHTDYYIRNN